MVAVRHGEVAAEPTHDPALQLLLLFLRVLPQHLHGREDQEGPKEVEDPVVARHELRPDTNHQATHHQRAKDAPEQHPVLVLQRDAQVLEDQRNHEHVVHTQRQLDDVSREELDRGHPPVVHLPVHGIHGLTEPEPMGIVGVVHEHGEKQREHNRANRKGQRFLQ